MSARTASSVISTTDILRRNVVGPRADAYRAAHQAYVAARERHGDVPELAGVSAGGMPERVKCLHVLVAHALAAGPGVNPLGDETVSLLPPWWADGPCVDGSEAGPVQP